MMVGGEGSYRGQDLLSYSNQRTIIDAKMDEHTHNWMQHAGGGRSQLPALQGVSQSSKKAAPILCEVSK